jgi:hypothetical protein
MSKPRSGWQDYRQAIFETGPRDLAGQMAAAEEAVFLRMEELRTSSDGQIERQAIEDAIRLLSVLKNEILRSTIAIENEQKLWLGDGVAIKRRAS